MSLQKPPEPFVTVIIPVLNNVIGLRACLDVLDQQSYPKERYEVLVIDNGSTDRMSDVTHAYSQAKLLFEDYPSQAAARNKGILTAKGDVLAFTDSDCIPELDWIEKGVAQLTRMPNRDYVGGKISVFFQNPERPTACELYESVFAFPQRNYIEEKRYSTTANLFTRKSVFDEVGLFKRNSYTGSDEEWGREVYSKGYGQVYAEDVSILHPARRTWKEMALKLARVRLSRYRKSLEKKPLLTNWMRLKWVVRSPLLLRLYPQMLLVFSDQRLVGVKQRVSVIYIIFMRAWFDGWIRLSIVCGIHLKHDYELLRESST